MFVCVELDTILTLRILCSACIAECNEEAVWSLARADGLNELGTRSAEEESGRVSVKSQMLTRASLGAACLLRRALRMSSAWLESSSMLAFLNNAMARPAILSRRVVTPPRPAFSFANECFEFKPLFSNGSPWLLKLCPLIAKPNTSPCARKCPCVSRVGCESSLSYLIIDESIDWEVAAGVDIFPPCRLGGFLGLSWR
jgi:hypothetical protein